jgi:replicative DNA helicase
VNHLNPSEAEQGVIGGVFMRPDCYDLANLVEEQFFDPRHRLIWRVIGEMRTASKPIDEQTVMASIEARGYQAVELAYVAELSLHVNTEAHVEYLAGLVREAALTRALLTAAGELVADVKAGRITGGEAVGAGLRAMSSLDTASGDTTKTIGELVKARTKELEEMVNRPGGALTGVPTGLTALDSGLGGLQPGIVTLGAARPKMGKSAFGQKVSDACVAAGIGVHVFSIEDSWRAYTDRYLARKSDVAAEKIRSLAMNTEEFRRLVGACHGATKVKGWIIDSRHGLTPDELVRSVRRHRKENNTRLVILDYFNRLRFNRSLSRQDQMREGFEDLCTAAADDGIAYLVFAQLNRGLEARDDKHPQMSDLKDCGALEEYAKAILSFYRESVYYESIPVEEHGMKRTRAADPSRMEIGVLKNSNGPEFDVLAKWHGPTMRISDWPEQERQ